MNKDQDIIDLQNQIDDLQRIVEDYQQGWMEHNHDGVNAPQVNWFDVEDMTVSQPTPLTTGTQTIQMNSRMFTITPTGNCTFNAQGGAAGRLLTFYITTSGTTSYTMTFGTNIRSVGTLATGTVDAKAFTVTFICIDGITWSEIARTAVQA